jgi:hypothetical protein
MADLVGQREPVPRRWTVGSELDSRSPGNPGCSAVLDHIGLGDFRYAQRVRELF